MIRNFFHPFHLVDTLTIISPSENPILFEKNWSLNKFLQKTDLSKLSLRSVNLFKYNLVWRKE
jgi:hypothetical protein